MKTKTMFIAIFLLLGIKQMWADVVIDKENFPDENFRDYLKRTTYGNDGLITEDEISEITKIDVTSLGTIISLKGIEHFTELTELLCSQNELKELDLSNNKALTKLICSKNMLTMLDISQNKALTWLDCSNNRLITLNISNNTELTTVRCYSNQLADLDLSNNLALRGLLCSSNQLTTLDLSNNTALDCLYCGYNKLTTLDLSKNLVLRDLQCENNYLEILDVSKNTLLAYFLCDWNRLTSLDVSKNPHLNYLYCSRNSLTSLDVSGHTKLKNIQCHRNNLTMLDVSGCIVLNELECYRNQIKGSCMDTFVNSLPTVTYAKLKIIYKQGEGNVMTTTQVAVAKAKGWIPACGEGSYWLEYSGSDPASIEKLPSTSSLIDEIFYDLQGRKSNHPSKGLYIKNSNKYIVK